MMWLIILHAQFCSSYTVAFDMHVTYILLLWYGHVIIYNIIKKKKPASYE